MKRLGIFSVFDKEGMIDPYLEYFILELKKVVSDLIIVVNGQLKCEEAKKLQRLSETVIFRKNYGFDGGAYKDIFVNHLKKEQIHCYDELVLCNDTCYGPFLSFQQVWEKMKDKKADFWGMNYIDNGLTNHIQGYFIVFRKSLIESELVYEYFQKNIDENCSDIHEIIATYEKGLSKYLEEKGYCCASYIEHNNLDMYKYGNILIRKYGFPFLKKKCFNSKYNDDMESVSDSLIFIKNNTNYDVKMIQQNSQRIYGVKIKDEIRNNKKYQQIEPPEMLTFKINKEKLLKFIEEANEIYIYGCGKYGKEIYFLYLKGNKKLKGFVVSKDQKREQKMLYGYPVQTISEISLSSSILVALNKKNRQDVMASINQKHVVFIL